jgi:hypothetical protein
MCSNGFEIFRAQNSKTISAHAEGLIQLFKPFKTALLERLSFKE